MITEHWSADCFLDAKGLACPMPLLKLKQQMNRMQAGETIRVETTDAGSIRDFDAFCKQAGHTLLAQIEQCEPVRPPARAGEVQSNIEAAAVSALIYGFFIKKCESSVSQG